MKKRLSLSLGKEVVEANNKKKKMKAAFGNHFEMFIDKYRHKYTDTHR